MPRSRHLSPQQLRDRLEELVRQVNALRPGAWEQLQVFLQQYPQIQEQIGSLSRWVEQAYVSLLADPDQVALPLLLWEQQQFHQQLLGEHPTAMERMLVDLICTNRLAVYHALQLAAQPASCASVRAQRSRCAEVEQRRFLQSMRTLATLRELMPRGLAPLDSVKLHQPEVKTRKKA